MILTKIGFVACQFYTNQKLTQILYAVHLKTPASSTKNVLLKKEIFTMVRKEFDGLSFPSAELLLSPGLWVPRISNYTDFGNGYEMWSFTHKSFVNNFWFQKERKERQSKDDADKKKFAKEALLKGEYQ